MSDPKIANVLLSRVLVTCRSKSSVSVSSWHKLQDEIENFLKDSPVDISEYQVF